MPNWYTVEAGMVTMETVCTSVPRTDRDACAARGCLQTARQAIELAAQPYWLNLPAQVSAIGSCAPTHREPPSCCADLALVLALTADGKKSTSTVGLLPGVKRHRQALLADRIAPEVHLRAFATKLDKRSTSLHLECALISADRWRADFASATRPVAGAHPGDPTPLAGDAVRFPPAFRAGDLRSVARLRC